MIPRQHKEGFGRTLRKYAREVGPYSAAVEVGAWVGASAVHILSQLGRLSELHLYDRWRADISEVRKLERFGEAGKIGDDLLPLCRANLAEYWTNAPVFFHKGDIREAKYEGQYDIGLYVDDASKNQIDEVLPAFESRFVSGCIVILCDFFYDACDVQRHFVRTQRDWEFIARDEHDPNVGIWRVR